MTLSSINTNAFMNGYFLCDINNNAQCNLLCDNEFGNECNNATFDCIQETDDNLCQCYGDGCNSQSIQYLYSQITTLSSTATLSTKRISGLLYIVCFVF